MECQDTAAAYKPYSRELYKHSVYSSKGNRYYRFGMTDRFDEHEKPHLPITIRLVVALVVGAMKQLLKALVRRGLAILAVQQTPGGSHDCGKLNVNSVEFALGFAG